MSYRGKPRDTIFKKVEGGFGQRISRCSQWVSNMQLGGDWKYKEISFKWGS